MRQSSTVNPCYDGAPLNQPREVALPAAVSARTGLSLVDAVNAAFLGILVILAACVFASTPKKLELAGFYAGAALLLLVAVRVRKASPPAPGWRRPFAFLYPIALLFILFESVFIIIPALRTVRYDDLLVEIDRKFLGTDATVWMDGWMRPWLTDLMHLFYFAYFPMPLVTLGLLFARGRTRELERAIFALLLCYYPSYLLYMVVPAAGPNLHLAASHVHPMEGPLFTAPIRAIIDTLEPVKIDAFPSVHACILLTTMIVTWRAYRGLFWAFVPLAAGIAVSLVYTRNHYVIDVVAGVEVSVLGVWAADRLYPRLSPRFAPHFPGDAP